MQFDCIEDGHIYSQWVTTKSATIFAKGTKVRICSVCGKLDGKVFKLTEAKVGINYPPL